MAVLKVVLHGKEISEVRLEAGQEYIFGRGDGCSFRLEDQPGISRQHFKVFEENGTWTAAVVSKFGELNVNGQNMASIDLGQHEVFRLSNYEFKFVAIRNAIDTAVAPEVAAEIAMAVGAEAMSPPPPPTSKTLSIVQNNHSSSAVGATPSAPVDFEGNDEATSVGAVVAGKPSLRIVKADGSETRIDLEGKHWLAGREDTCDIFLPERKASRRQFEIHSTPEGYLITDLGSANGTVLNGETLLPDVAKPINSGDVIGVQSMLIYFEIRDPNFEKRLVAIPQAVMAPLVVAPAPRFEIINYPVPGGGGGAVRVDELSAADQKTKMIRIGLIAFILVAGLFAAFGQKDDSTSNPPSANTKSDGWSRLTPQQKQTVKEIYVTARNLYMQGKFENADEQLKKLHNILPDGYEKSKEMEEDCIAQRANAERLALMEQERKQIEEQRRMIDRNIKDCNALANTTTEIAQIRSCLAPTIGLDPSNALANDLISRVERRVTERNQKIAAQKDYSSRVARGQNLYDKALALQKKSEWYPAIAAYNQHLSADLPDPNGLKNKSQAAIKQIRGMISSRVDELLRVAQSAYQARNYKEALEAAKKAKEFDSNSEKAAEYIGKVRRELSAQMRVIYEDAILYEGVGRVQDAQAKWKVIMEKDTPDGEYYQKSRIKLRNYSDQ